MVEMGVPGFKCFLIHSGVEEFPAVSRAQVLEALQELRDTGAVLLFHAECELEQERNISSILLCAYIGPFRAWKPTILMP